MARNEGAYEYRFANDLLFAGGPGAYLLAGDALLGEPYTLRAQALFSGETKGNDVVGDTHRTDTGVTGLYLGPAFAFGWGTHLGAEIAADLPVLHQQHRPADRPGLPAARRRHAGASDRSAH